MERRVQEITEKKQQRRLGSSRSKRLRPPGYRTPGASSHQHHQQLTVLLWHVKGTRDGEPRLLTTRGLSLCLAHTTNLGLCPLNSPDFSGLTPSYS